MTQRRAYAVLIACVLAAYGTVVLGTFVYDDVHTARDNPAITALANIPRFFVDVDLFSAVDCRMFRPVVLTTYALDHAMGGGAAWAFKLTNLLVHAGVALALFQLALRLRATPGGALFAAAAFAVHPLASEAVNTVSGRSDLGLALGLVVGMLAHLRAAADGRFAFVTAAGAFIACGCKELGVVLPLLLLAVDPPRLRVGIWRRELLRHLLPGLVVVAYLLWRQHLFGMATTALPRVVGGTDPQVGYGRDLVTQLSTMATLLPRALAQCVVPIGLSLDPPVVFARSPCTAPVVCGAGFVVGVLFLGWRGATRDGLRRTGMALACACALPWIVLPLNLPYLEHRMYVPLAGIALVLAAAMSRRANVAARRAAISNGSGLGSERHSSAARPRHAVAGVMLGAGAVLAMVRTLEYRDATKMWERVVAQRPDSTRALCCLAVRRVEDGEPAAALPLLQRAVALWPRHVAALRNLAELNLRLLPAPGSALAALLAADKLVAIAPDNPFDRLLRSRALALAAEATAFLAWYDDAEREALHCLQIAPPKALVYRTAAAARTRQGDHARALALLDAGLAAGFMTVPLQLERIDCLRRLARNAEASAVLAQLMGNDPFDPVLLQRVGRQGDAAAAPPPR